jgi:hypothetical protein
MRGTAIIGTFAGLLVSSLFAHAQEPLDFRDEFVGEKLAPEFRLLNPDPDRIAMVDGEYILLVTHKDRKNVVEYTGRLPEAYSLTVRFATVPEYQAQGYGLFLTEADNRLSAGLYNYCCLTPKFYFSKVLSGEESTITVDLEEPRPVYLKITKSGVEYVAEYSFDGTTWMRIGTHVVVRPFVRAAFSAYNGADAPESPVRVDSFEIVDLTAR